MHTPSEGKQLERIWNFMFFWSLLRIQSSGLYHHVVSKKLFLNYTQHCNPVHTIQMPLWEPQIQHKIIISWKVTLCILVVNCQIVLHHIPKDSIPWEYILSTWFPVACFTDCFKFILFSAKEIKHLFITYLSHTWKLIVKVSKITNHHHHHHHNNLKYGLRKVKHITYCIMVCLNDLGLIIDGINCMSLSHIIWSFPDISE